MSPGGLSNGDSPDVTPLLVEPEDVGCRAAQNLCGLPVVQTVGSALPPADATLDAAWALGVCTTPHQLELLTELRRMVRSPGRIALLAFVARQSVSDEQPEGPPQSVDRLTQLVNDAGLRIYAWQSTADVPAIPQDGLAASTRPPTPWPSGTARRRRPNAETGNR